MPHLYTFAGSEALVDRHLKAIIENGRPPENISPADRSNLVQLKEPGIMVDEYFDEDPELEYWSPPQLSFALSIMAENLS